MSHFGFPASTVFQLDKGTDLALRTHGAVGTQVGIRADLTARFHNTSSHCEALIRTPSPTVQSVSILFGPI